MRRTHVAPVLLVVSILAGCSVGLFKQRPEVPFNGEGERGEVKLARWKGTED